MKPKKVEHFLIQKGEHQGDCLTRPLFDVNIRRFKYVPAYRNIVIAAISYMRILLMDYEYSNYPRLAGISGANVGVPWNIILVKMKDEKCLTMINPSVTSLSDGKITVQSNCGSLRLPEKIAVERREWMEVFYYDIKGEPKKGKFAVEDRACTIQHEIDHNRGVLITDFDQHL